MEWRLTRTRAHSFPIPLVPAAMPGRPETRSSPFPALQGQDTSIYTRRLLVPMSSVQ